MISEPSVRKAFPAITLIFISVMAFSAQQSTFKYGVEYKCGNERVVVRYCRNDSGQQVPAGENYCQVEFPDRPRRVAEIAVFASMLKSEIAVRLQSCVDPSATTGKGTTGATDNASGAANQALSRGQAFIKAKDYSGAMAELKEALRLDPRFAMAFYYVGVAQYNLKEYTVANAAFERALQLNVATPHVSYHWIGDCQRALGQHEKALSAYREAVRVKPDYASGFNGMGLAYYAMKDYSNAGIFFDQAARLDPKTTIYRKNIGTAYLGSGKKDEAMKVYNALVPVDPKLAGELLDEITKPAATAAATTPWTPADDRFDEGLKFYNSKDYQKALASFQEALRLKPNLANASFQIGRAHYQLKQYPQAIAAFEKSLQLKSDNPHFLYDWIGDSYDQLKQHDKALAAFNESRRLKPDYDQVIQKIGNSHYSLKQYAEALAAYQAAIKLKPDSALYHASAGDSYSALKQYDKAILSYGEAVRLDNKYDYAWNMIGVNHYKLKQYPAAVTAFEAAVKLKPDNALYQMNLGDAYFDLGRKAEALAVHKKLVTLDKAKADELLSRINTSPAEEQANALADAALRKGHVAFEAKEYAKAIVEYQKAVAVKPNNAWLASAHYSIGASYIFLRDYAQATANLLTAARLDPTDAAVFGNLGYVYERTLQFPKAVTAYQEAMRLNAKDPAKAARNHESVGTVYALMDRKADAMAVYNSLQKSDPARAKSLLSTIELGDKEGPAGILAFSGDVADMDFDGSRPDDALEYYRNAAKLKPSKPAGLYSAGEGLMRMDKPSEALAVFRAVLATKPGTEDVARGHYLIGRTYNWTGEYAKAIPEIREAQRLKADHDYSYELGRSYAGLKQFPAALTAYQDAEKLEPDDSTTKLRISDTYVALGQPEKAITYLEGKTQIVENTAPILYLELGKLYLSSKRFPDAVRILSKAVQVSPKYRDAHFTLGMAYLAMGQKREAMRTYTDLRPLDNDLAQKLLAEINALK